jgi:gamma-glutamyltranspeptidase/glutathione hydrolase
LTAVRAEKDDRVAMTSDAQSNLGPWAVPPLGGLPELDVPRRGPVYGRRFAVATDYPYASHVALNLMQRGGNAMDAALAASAINAVVKPHQTQLGGDAFVLVWRKRTGEVDCLNAGGKAPLKATLDLFPAGVPSLGPRSVSVPGLVDAWMELFIRYATMPLTTLLGPAVELCEAGFPVTARLSEAMAVLAQDETAEAAAARQAFLVEGQRPYAPGELLRQTELAEVLQRFIEDERDGFYGGRTAELIAQGMRVSGGLIVDSEVS